MKLVAKMKKKIEAIRIYSQDVGMGFSIEKRDMLIIKRWKRESVAK